MTATNTDSGLLTSERVAGGILVLVGGWHRGGLTVAGGGAVPGRPTGCGRAGTGHGGCRRRDVGRGWLTARAATRPLSRRGNGGASRRGLLPGGGAGGYRPGGVGDPFGPGAYVEGGRDAGQAEGEDLVRGSDAGTAVGADGGTVGRAEGGEAAR